jgi:hypothetical protein
MAIYSFKRQQQECQAIGWFGASSRPPAFFKIKLECYTIVVILSSKSDITACNGNNEFI